MKRIRKRTALALCAAVTLFWFPAKTANAAGPVSVGTLSQVLDGNLVTDQMDETKATKVGCGSNCRRWRRRARRNRRNAWIAGAAGFAAGAAVGSRRARARECWHERQRRYDDYGNRYYKRVRVCN